MILYFVFLGIKLTYGMNPENLRISENSRISRETDDLGSDDEDYSRSSGDYDDIINEDYSDSEYELPVSETVCGSLDYSKIMSNKSNAF